MPTHSHGRPRRDRAIVYVLLSTGLRREEVAQVQLRQLQPAQPDRLRASRRARLTEIRGKGNTQRTVFLSNDARQALAEYLQKERPRDS